MAQKPQRYGYQEQLRATQMDGEFVVYDSENNNAWLSANEAVEITQ